MTRREYPVQEANGMVPDYQPAFWALDQLKACIGGTVPRRYESSRCVCALTSPGRSATEPRS